jgi:hypothetical protein
MTKAERETRLIDQVMAEMTEQIRGANEGTGLFTYVVDKSHLIQVYQALASNVIYRDGSHSQKFMLINPELDFVATPSHPDLVPVPPLKRNLMQTGGLKVSKLPSVFNGRKFSLVPTGVAFYPRRGVHLQALCLRNTLANEIHARTAGLSESDGLSAQRAECAALAEKFGPTLELNLGRLFTSRLPDVPPAEAESLGLILHLMSVLGLGEFTQLASFVSDQRHYLLTRAALGSPPSAEQQAATIFEQFPHVGLW